MKERVALAGKTFVKHELRGARPAAVSTLR